MSTRHQTVRHAYLLLIKSTKKKLLVTYSHKLISIKRKFRYAVNATKIDISFVLFPKTKLAKFIFNNIEDNIYL